MGWRKNEADPAKRTATIFIYEDDGVTPAPMATSFTTGSGGNTRIRCSGTGYADASGALVNVGVDGEWEYTGTQSESNVDATEVVIMVSKSSFNPARTIVNIVDPADSVEDFMSYVLRSGRTVRGHLRRMDALYFCDVTGLLNSLVTVKRPGGSINEFTATQDPSAGTRDEVDCTNSETP